MISSFCAVLELQSTYGYSLAMAAEMVNKGVLATYIEQ